MIKVRKFLVIPTFLIMTMLLFSFPVNEETPKDTIKEELPQDKSVINSTEVNNAKIPESRLAGPEFMTGFRKVVFGGYALREDGSLWEIGLFEERHPRKIMDGVRDIDVDDEAIVLKDNGTAWVLIYNSDSGTVQPVKVMDSIESISSCEGFISAVDASGSLWIWRTEDVKLTDAESLAKIEPEKIMENVQSASDYLVIDRNSDLFSIEGLIKQDDSLESKPVKLLKNIKFVREQFAITNEGQLWCCPDLSWRKPAFFVDDGVKYVDSMDMIGAVIKEDGSLWAWGFCDDNIPPGIRGESYELIMKDVKNACCYFQTIVAVKEDGSLWAWGGDSPASHYSVPRQVMENVSSFYPESGMALTRDDTLYRAEFDMDQRLITEEAIGVKEVQADGNLVMSDGTFRYIDYLEGRDLLRLYPGDTKEVFTDGIRNIILRKNGTLWADSQEDGVEIYNYQIGYGIDHVVNVNCLSHYILALKDDGSLWIWHNDFTDYVSHETYPETIKPREIIGNVRQVYSNDDIAYVITEKGELFSIYSDYDKEDTALAIQGPDKIMSGVDSFYKQLDCAVTKQDGTIWMLENDLSYPNKENYPEIITGNLKMYPERIDNILQADRLFYIKNDHSLWASPEFCCTREPTAADEFEKIMDNVSFVDVQDMYDDYGVAVKDDHTLWEFGCGDWYYYSDITPELRSEYMKPRKLGDSFKNAKVMDQSCMALKLDGSLWTWGNNACGLLGNDSMDSSSTPVKCLDDVAWYEGGYYDCFAITKDGILWNWGPGFEFGHNVPYTFYPVRVAALTNDPGIYHLQYTDVYPGIDINVLAKINYSEYRNEVLVQCTREGVQSEIPMKKCGSGYYDAVIPGIEGSGAIRYRIIARSEDGNSIETDYFTAEILERQFE